MSLCMVTLEKHLNGVNVHVVPAVVSILHKIDEHQIDCDGLRSVCFEAIESQDVCDQIGSGVVA